MLILDDRLQGEPFRAVDLTQPVLRVSSTSLAGLRVAAPVPPTLVPQALPEPIRFTGPQPLAPAIVKPDGFPYRPPPTAERLNPLVQQRETKLQAMHPDQWVPGMAAPPGYVVLFAGTRSERISPIVIGGTASLPKLQPQLVEGAAPRGVPIAAVLAVVLVAGFLVLS